MNDQIPLKRSSGPWKQTLLRGIVGIGPAHRRICSLLIFWNQASHSIMDIWRCPFPLGVSPNCQIAVSWQWYDCNSSRENWKRTRGEGHCNCQWQIKIPNVNVINFAKVERGGGVGRVKSLSTKNYDLDFLISLP